MQKNLIALTLLAVSGFLSSVFAADGTINFTGNILDASCTVNTAASNLNAQLGDVGVGALNGAVGKTASQARIDIVLTNCPASANNASVRFGGTTDPINPDLLQISGSGPIATGVGIALYERDAVTQIPVAAPSASLPVSASGDTTLTYYAKYMSTQST
ncbi:type 1 fimbrial protein, partial [Enterobacter cloacae]